MPQRITLINHLSHQELQQHYRQSKKCSRKPPVSCNLVIGTREKKRRSSGNHWL